MPTKTIKENSLPAAQYDSAWKDILDAYFPEFIAFFYPKLFEAIDWSKGYETLDKELQAITSNAIMGKRFVDKLVRVYLRHGGERWLLIHIEIQAERETQFAERLFIYYYRLFDRYKQPIITLAVLADDQPSWRPQAYQAYVDGTEVLTFRFFTTKLLDYRKQQQFFEQTTNPFSIIVLAHLAALDTRQNPQSRFNYKFSLTKQLYERGLGKDAILKLYRFIDWVLTLPEDLEIRYNESIHELEESRAVRYITSAERIGMKKGFEQGLLQGIEQGIQKGKQEGKQEGEYLLLVRLLEHKFHIIPDIYRQRLAQADAEILLALGERVLTAKRLEDVFDVPN